jgi:hypothetical protein
MKKLVYLILVATLILTFSACSNNTDYIKAEIALEIAKKHDNNKDIKWMSKLEENKEFELNDRLS